MEEKDDHSREAAEGHEAQKTDPAVDVQELVAVIPPARVEELLHPPGSEIFQKTVDDPAEQKDL